MSDLIWEDCSHFHSPQFNLISDNNSYWLLDPVPSISCPPISTGDCVPELDLFLHSCPCPHQIILVLLQWLSCVHRACGWPGLPHCWLQSILALSRCPHCWLQSILALSRCLVSYELSSWGVKSIWVSTVSYVTGWPFLCIKQTKEVGEHQCHGFLSLQNF